MRKRALFLLAGILAAVLCACGRKVAAGENGGGFAGGDGGGGFAGEADGGGFTEENHAVPEGQTEHRKSEDRGLDCLLAGNSNRRYFAADDGFYYFTEYDKIGDGLYGCHLMYIDYNTRQEVYLCSDSACLHNSEKCGAVFLGAEFGDDSLLFVHENFLYVLCREYDMDGSQSLLMSADNSPVSAERRAASLYRMGLDGSSRKKVFTFSKDATLEDRVFQDGKNLWFVVKELKFEREGNTTYTSSAKRALMKYDSAQNKLTDTISLNTGDIYHKVIGAFGSKFVLESIKYPNGMTEAEAGRLSEDEWKKLMAASSTICETLDRDSGEKKEIFRTTNDSGLSLDYAFYGSTMYVADHKDGGIFGVDLLTGEQGRLTDKNPNMIYKALKDSLCCWGEDRALYFVDIKSGEMSRCTLTDRSLGWRLEVLADTADHVLVIYDYDAIPHRDGSYEITKYHYGLIAKADLYQSVGNFEPIHMVGRGR